MKSRKSNEYTEFRILKLDYTMRHDCCAKLSLKISLLYHLNLTILLLLKFTNFNY